MFLNKTKVLLLFAFAAICLSGRGFTIAAAQLATKHFTVADEVGLAQFGDPYTGHADAVQFSPDGKYVAVDTERGRLDRNRPEDSLRFYRCQEVRNYLEHSDQSRPPSPLWIVTRSTDKEGPIIRDWRWLADSTGVVFLERISFENQRLMLADLRKKLIEPLTSAQETVKAFDIVDRRHYVYTVADRIEHQKMQAERKKPAIVGTGRDLWELILPDDPAVVRDLGRRSLCAVIDGEHFVVKKDGNPIVLSEGALVLSPDGLSLVTTLPVYKIPSSWETLYPPPYASSAYQIRAGSQDLRSGRELVRQYVRIDLLAGSVQSLTGAPVSNSAGWEAFGKPSWSSDGHEILLPGTFLKAKDEMPSRPCLAVVDLESSTRTCVEMLRSRTQTGVEEGFHWIWGAQFVAGDKRRVIVKTRNRLDWSFGSTEYRRAADGSWQLTGHSQDLSDFRHDGLEITVKQGLNEPPVLIATTKQTLRVIWDPNLQLKNIDLGFASVYKWKDKEGRDWTGGLYKPSDYKSGQRYPLVIQTHGFIESEFRPSGIYPTAFAARALAGAGIVVLQVDEHCPPATPSEGLCAVAGYEAAVNQLVSDGLVDPENIGIIGFSRTCFYVMETLTTGSLHFKAASITAGFMADYFVYTLTAVVHDEANSMIGAPPFGEGLQLWLKRSPGFNLEKINAPLLVVGGGPSSLLGMWAPYSGLRYLRKPVDLMMLNVEEHVLTNPGARMASQGGTVDWFRFWLKGEEDASPSKTDQYARWRELRRLQEENNVKLTKP